MPSIYHSYAHLVTEKITSYIYILDIFLGAEDLPQSLPPSLYSSGEKQMINMENKHNNLRD